MNVSLFKCICRYIFLTLVFNFSRIHHLVEELEIEYLWDLLCDPTWSVITRGKSVPGVDMSPPTPGFMLWQVDLCKGLVLVSSDILASLLDVDG